MLAMLSEVASSSSAIARKVAAGPIAKVCPSWMVMLAFLAIIRLFAAWMRKLAQLSAEPST